MRSQHASIVTHPPSQSQPSAGTCICTRRWQDAPRHLVLYHLVEDDVAVVTRRVTRHFIELTMQCEVRFASRETAEMRARCAVRNDHRLFTPTIALSAHGFWSEDTIPSFMLLAPGPSWLSRISCLKEAKPALTHEQEDVSNSVCERIRCCAI